LLLCITGAQPALADMKTGDVRGVVFYVDPARGRSVIPGAEVRLEGLSSSVKTVTDQQGNYSLTAVASADYQIEVKTPGFVGSKAVTVVAGVALDVPIELSTYIGITSFAAGVQGRLFAKVDNLIRTGNENEFFNVAVQQLADEGVHVGFTSTDDMPWAEIDDPGDLAFARLYVFPKLTSQPIAA
jgi:hypothetical protein